MAWVGGVHPATQTLLVSANSSVLHAGLMRREREVVGWLVGWVVGVQTLHAST